MAKVRYLQSTKEPSLSFKITKLIKPQAEGEPPKVMLLGQTGKEFEIELTEKVLQKYGYEIRVAEVPDANASTVSA